MPTPPMNQPANLPPMAPNMREANGPVKPRIKPEPGLEPQQPPHIPYPNAPLNMPNATTAAQRAVQNLQANYGPRAAASIDAIRGGQQQNPPPNYNQMTQQQAQANYANSQQAQHQAMQNLQQQQQRTGQHPQIQQAHPQGHSQPPMTPEQYQKIMAEQSRRQLQQRQAAQQQQQQNGQQQQHQNGANGQTDGPGDEEESITVIKQFNAAGEEIGMSTVEIDNLIRSRILANGQAMEGGGLMVSLKSASKSVSTSRHRERNPNWSTAQTDGPGDSDSEGVKNESADEDAINSDLDDPDDGLGDDEDDEEGMGHIMLCMYDKVQRVKNKWYVFFLLLPLFPALSFSAMRAISFAPDSAMRKVKGAWKETKLNENYRKCVMKDGVLTVNGKEYVFHKATGEFEW